MYQFFYIKHTNQTALITYLLTPWSRILLEKLTGSQLVEKFPSFCGNRRFIARHLSPSWASLTQSGTPSHFLKIHPNIILPSTPGSPQWSPSLRFPHQNPVHTSPLPHTRYMPSPSHSSWFYHPHKLVTYMYIFINYDFLERIYASNFRCTEHDD